MARVTGPQKRFLLEHRVSVGEIGGVEITGSCDLYDRYAGIVLDWKITGDSTIKKLRANGPSLTYQRQAHLYGRGWQRKGYDPKHVVIAFLPRNAVTGFGNAYYWTAEYDETIAVTALERANTIQANLTALETISIEARDNWISGLPRDPDCWDCARWKGREIPATAKKPGAPQSPPPVNPSDPFGF
jgi:hypothetical protein